jgi:hypothetical protein
VLQLQVRDENDPVHPRPPLGVVLVPVRFRVRAFRHRPLAQTEIQTLEFPYFTLRNRTASTEPGKVYGGERSDLKAGIATSESSTSAFFRRWPTGHRTFLQEELLRVQAVREMDPPAVLDGLEATAAARVVPALYVHGYYIGFEKGCRRAALLQQNADLAGRFLWFSWPSDGAAAYTPMTRPTSTGACRIWRTRSSNWTGASGPGTVDVIGHSLGARGVVLALAEVANRHPDIRLGHVVLLAPDMDFGIFERILPRIAPIAGSMTVYATTGDRPLALSAQLHGYAAAGGGRKRRLRTCGCRGHRSQRSAQRRPDGSSLPHLQPLCRRGPAPASERRKAGLGAKRPCREGQQPVAPPAELGKLSARRSDPLPEAHRQADGCPIRLLQLQASAPGRVRYGLEAADQKK